MTRALVDDRSKWPTLERALASLPIADRLNLQARAQSEMAAAHAAVDARFARRPKRLADTSVTVACLLGRLFELLEREWPEVVARHLRGRDRSVA